MWLSSTLKRIQKGTDLMTSALLRVMFPQVYMTLLCHKCTFLVLFDSTDQSRVYDLTLHYLCSTTCIVPCCVWLLFTDSVVTMYCSHCEMAVGMDSSVVPSGKPSQA